MLSFSQHEPNVQRVFYIVLALLRYAHIYKKTIHVKIAFATSKTHTTPEEMSVSSVATSGVVGLS